MKDEARNEKPQEVIAIPAVAEDEPASGKLPASRSNDLAQVTSVPLMQHFTKFLLGNYLATGEILFYIITLVNVD